MTTQAGQLQQIADQAMRERGFEPDFPPAVLDAVAHLAGPGAADGHARDLRALLWASIDNDDSRDLDQLTVAAPSTGGATTILVAVADVDRLVSSGSPIDGHAGRNTTSVYTAAKIFPMLPERLSTDLTSLADHQDRAALVIELVVESAGGVRSSDIYPAIVRNRAKLAYSSVGPWLEGRGAPPAPITAVSGLDENLRLQDAAAERLKSIRHAHGALTLETIEARPVFDADALRDLTVDRKNRATELIEDLMIAANAATAAFLNARRSPSIRRVVRTPERWDRIVTLAAQFGGRLPPAPDASALEAFLVARRAADPEKFPDLSLSVVKLLGPGEYVVQLPGQQTSGHFGLAVSAYTHATAPNRRYVDLITQRLLKAVLAGGAPAYSSQDLATLAAHCTEREDAANRVERQVRKSAAAMLLASRVGEEFDAIVTGASEKGTWVRLLSPPVEGKLQSGAQGADVADRVRVRLVSTDVARGFIDFARV